MPRPSSGLPISDRRVFGLDALTLLSQQLTQARSSLAPQTAARRLRSQCEIKQLRTSDPAANSRNRKLGPAVTSTPRNTEIVCPPIAAPAGTENLHPGRIAATLAVIMRPISPQIP